MQWALSPIGAYLPDKPRTPTQATWQPYQADILNHLFPAGDGPLPYSSIYWSETKKSGKTLLAAALQLYFAFFVEIPGEQYCLANSLLGASDRTFASIQNMLDAATRQGAIKSKDWRVVGTEIHFSNGARIKALPNSFKTGAGGNPSLSTIDEVWGFNATPEDLGLLAEFEPVPTREISVSFYTGYQGPANKPSAWHAKIDTVLKEGKPVAELAHIEDGDGGPACWRSGRTFLFFSHVGRHPWHTSDFLAEQRRKMPLNEYLRLWENRRVEGTDAFCTRETWERLHDVDLRGLHASDARPIVLGVDAATKADCSALVACAWNAERKRVEVVYSRIWQPTNNEPLRLTETVGPEVVRLHREHAVVGVYFDPYQMTAISEMCRGAGVNMVEFPQGPRRIQSDTHLFQLLNGNNLAHTGDARLGEHVTNAAAQSSERGLRIVKELGTAKVDGAVALSMSALGAVQLLAQAERAVLAMSNNPFYG